MKVFFDATVLAGALINPTGPNARLLDLASMGGPLRAATSDVVALEFLRHAVDGNLGGIRYDLSDVQAFFDAYAPLLEIAQAPIGTIEIYRPSQLGMSSVCSLDPTREDRGSDASE